MHNAKQPYGQYYFLLNIFTASRGSNFIFYIVDTSLGFEVDHNFQINPKSYVSHTDEVILLILFSTSISMTLSVIIYFISELYTSCFVFEFWTEKVKAITTTLTAIVYCIR